MKDVVVLMIEGLLFQFDRRLIDFENQLTRDTGLEFPFIFLLYEISQLHPTEVFEGVTKASFDREHYTSGHRMVLLRRLMEVIQLLAKSRCFSCYDQVLGPQGRHRSELISICPEFFLKYYDVRKRARTCVECGGGRTNNVAEGTTSENACETAIEGFMTWKDIVDNRIKAKTRYFHTPRKKTPIVIQDDYSSKFVPIAWASLANRVLSHTNFFMDEEERKLRGAPHDQLLAEIFRVLGRILLGIGGSVCPHLLNIAKQGTILVLLMKSF